MYSLSFKLLKHLTTCKLYCFNAWHPLEHVRAPKSENHLSRSQRKLDIRLLIGCYKSHKLIQNVLAWLTHLQLFNPLWVILVLSFSGNWLSLFSKYTETVPRHYWSKERNLQSYYLPKNQPFALCVHRQMNANIREWSCCLVYRHVIIAIPIWIETGKHVGVSSILQ